MPAPCPRGSGFHGPLRSADSPPKLNPPGAETSRAYQRGPSPSSEEESALPRAGPAAGPSPGQRMPGDVTHLLLVGHGHLRLQHLLTPLLVLAQQPEVTSHCSSVASAGQEKSPGARGTLESPSLLGAGLPWLKALRSGRRGLLGAVPPWFRGTQLRAAPQRTGEAGK